MVVYIQKKIKSIWRTVLTVEQSEARQAFDHLCKQYCQHKFRISTKKTDDMPIKSKGFSRDEALDALCDIQLVDLTWKQGKETFRKIVNIIEQVRERYER